MTRPRPRPRRHPALWLFLGACTAFAATTLTHRSGRTLAAGPRPDAAGEPGPAGEGTATAATPPGIGARPGTADVETDTDTVPGHTRPAASRDADPGSTGRGDGPAAAARTPRWGSRLRVTGVAVLLFVALGVALGLGAWAYWGGIAASGANGVAAAATVNQGPTPTAVAGSAQSVVVSWPAGALNSGQPASGYQIRRYATGNPAAQTVGAGCATTVTGVTCTEAGVPLGAWQYTVTPLIGTHWRGTESARSAQTDVAATVLTLAKTVFGGPLPSATTGSLTGFAAGEALTYRLDAATALSGSPAVASASGSATISSLTIPAGTTDGAHTVHVIGGSGSQASLAITVDTTAPTASALLSPTANGAGWNNTSPVAVTLSGADVGGSGVSQLRYTIDGSTPTGSSTLYSTVLSVSVTTTVKFLAVDAAGNASTVQTQLVKIDNTAPANALTISGLTGNAVLTGTTIVYRGAAGGSFTLTNTLTDAAGSGAASSGTATLGGTSTGWTHTSGAVSTPAGGPYVSAAFGWAPGTSSSPTQSVTGTDVAGNTTTTLLTFVDDSTGPTGGSVDATGLTGTGSRYSTGTTLNVALAKGTDANGPATTGAQLLRATATLTSPGTTNGTCGTFGNYTLVTGGTDPASPKADTVTDQACYRYQYVVPDWMGNSTTYTSGDIKVDTTAPSAATLAFSALSNAHPIGTTVYYRPSVAGSFTTTAAAADLASGIASYAFPTLGTGWTSTPGVTGVNAYGWTANPAAPGVKNLTATGNNTLTSPTTAFTPTADGSAPTGGSASHVNGYTTGLAVTVTFTGATNDVGSGINPTSGRLKRTSAPLVDGVCGTFATTVDVNNPSSPYIDSTVTSGNCYDYQYIMSDNVGNTAFWPSGSIAKVDYAAAVTADAGLLSYWRLGESSGTAMADSKGTNTGSYANGPTLGAAGALTGDANTAATYNGTTQYSQAVATTGIPIGAAPRSVEMWFKTTSVAHQTLFEYGSFGTGQEFGLYLRANNNDIVAWGFGGAGYDYTFPLATPVTDGNWHQVVKTYDGTTLAVYIDGKLLASQATVRNTVMDADGSFGIGAALPLTGNGNSGKYFNGSLDEVSLYTTALGASTVADHYNLARGTDTLGPAGGAVDAVGLVGTGSRYSTGTALSVGFTKGTDSAGVAPTGATLTRATGTLSATGTANGACTAFGAYSLVTGGTDPTSPKADTVTDQACYRYRYVVTDNLGYATTYNSGDIKVDTTAPAAPSLTFAALANTYWAGAGNPIYYRPGATTGSFSATAAATDPKSGIASYAFPALGTNWSSTPGATGVTTYSWSGVPAAPGTKTVTATNHATGTSPTSSFTTTADGTAPTGGSVTYTNGYTTGASVSVSFTSGTDTLPGSGMNAAADLLERKQAPLTNGVCGSYDSYATISADPASPYVDNGVANGYCYQYQYVYADRVGNAGVNATGSTSVAKVDYAAAVAATTGALGQWRLGDANISSDTFTDAAGTTLSAHTPQIGAGWTRYVNDTVASAAITPDGRLRRDGSLQGSAGYYTSAVPPSANYQVEADIYVKSVLANDYVGVVGRWDTSNTNGLGTYYVAGFSKTLNAWELRKNVNNVGASLGTSAQATMTAGQTYHLTLDMRGSTIRLLVNGVQVVTATDSSITAAGRAGVRLGTTSGGWTAVTDTTGLHLDNVSATGVTTGTMLDSKGTNHGTYANGVPLGAAGALANNTAATFNGTTQYATVTRGIQDDFSIEFWFKSTQGIGTGAHWWEGAGLVDAEKTALWYDFGVSLRADGKVVAGTGGDGGDVSIVSGTGGYNDNSWHHVVFTRTKASGALKLYVDGATAATGTGSISTLNSTPLLNLGRLANATNYFAGSLDEVAVYTTAVTAGTVLDHYNLGASGAAAFSQVSDDLTGPTGGSVDAAGLTGAGARYSTTTNLSIVLNKGTDGDSGLAAGGAQLRRSTATLTSAGTLNGTCGTFTASVQVGADDPGTPVADTVPTAPACYRYEYVVADSVGNSTTYTSGDIKVDTTAPAAPTLSFSTMVNAYWSGTGTDVYYRGAATTGNFTMTAAATDTHSGIAAYTMPTLGTGWTAPSGGTGVQVYSWSAANPAAPVGAQYATAANNAGLTATGAGFTMINDAVAPTAGSVTFTDGVYPAASVTVTFSAGSDAASGVNPNGGLLQRQSSTQTGGVCNTFGAFTTVSGGVNPTSPFTDTSVSGSNCYRYQYVTTDRVGNQSATAGTSTARISSAYGPTVVASSGLVSYWRLGDTAGTVATDSAPIDVNNGSYVNSPLLGSTGALNSDTNTAVTFNGTTQYASAARQIQDDLSIEFWFKSTGGTGTGTQWWNGTGLVDAESTGSQLDFGVSLRSDGRVVAGTGSVSGDLSIVSTAGGYNDGTWRHVVFTRVRTSGAMKLYVDGAVAASGPGRTGSLTSTPTLNFGRLASGSNYFNGSLDEIAIYNVVLTDADVFNHYALR